MDRSCKTRQCKPRQLLFVISERALRNVQEQESVSVEKPKGICHGHDKPKTVVGAHYLKKLSVEDINSSQGR
jgi:hypothetical protein